MSFGYAIGDFLLLTQIAWDVVQNSRKACGAHDELTSEVTSLHIVLRRLEVEVSKPNSILTRGDDDGDRREELAQLSGDCRRVLRVLDGILEKYNALSEEKRSVTKLWKRVQFGNGEMLDLAELRLKVVTSTSALTLFLNLLSIGSQGKVETYMENQGGELREMRRSLNWITASMQAKSPATAEGSILTNYAGDDKAIWKDLRRELIREGFSSEVLKKHKETIKEYVMELGNRGALDDIEENSKITNLSASGSARSPEPKSSAKDNAINDIESTREAEVDVKLIEKSGRLQSQRPEKSLERTTENRHGISTEQQAKHTPSEAERDDRGESEQQHHIETSQSDATFESSSKEKSPATPDEPPLFDSQDENEEALNPQIQPPNDKRDQLKSEFEILTVEQQTDSAAERSIEGKGGVNISPEDISGANHGITSAKPFPIIARLLHEANIHYSNIKNPFFERRRRNKEWLFGPYRTMVYQFQPWRTLNVLITPQLFHSKMVLYGVAFVSYMPHVLCYWIARVSSWLDKGQNLDAPLSKPSALLREFHRLVARSCACYTRLQASKARARERDEFQSLFRSIIVDIYCLVRDGLYYSLQAAGRENQASSNTVWLLDENLGWDLEDESFVTNRALLVGGAKFNIQQLHDLVMPAPLNFLDGILAEEDADPQVLPARKCYLEDIFKRLQVLLVSFKRWHEESLLREESFRTWNGKSRFRHPVDDWELDYPNIAKAAYELKKHNLALETWSLQNDYHSKDKDERFSFFRSENSLSEILERCDEAQENLFAARQTRFGSQEPRPADIALNEKPPELRIAKKDGKKKKK